METRVLKTDRIVVKETVLELLHGLDDNQVKELCVTFIETVFKNIISNNAIEVLSKYKEEGYRIILISASFDVYLNYIKDYINFDDLICTKTKTVLGKLYIDGKNCYGDEKVVRLNDLLKSKSIELDFDNSFFYTDHHSDLPLMYLVGHPHVVNGNAKLIKTARRNNWPILNWQ